MYEYGASHESAKPQRTRTERLMASRRRAAPARSLDVRVRRLSVLVQRAAETSGASMAPYGASPSPSKAPQEFPESLRTVRSSNRRVRRLIGLVQSVSGGYDVTLAPSGGSP